MGEARRRKLAGHTEPKTKRQKANRTVTARIGAAGGGHKSMMAALMAMALQEPRIPNFRE